MNCEYYEIKLLIIKTLILSYNIYFLRIFFGSSKQFNIDDLPTETYKIYKNNETMMYLKKNIIRKFNLYIYKCLNYDYDYDYPLIQNPKISAIIPLYNGEKYIKYSLSSIQNQNMKEIEIILIDDCSKDNTLLKVKKFMKKDKRIRLINNFENRKILYSKSIAALNANGKYIIQLDQDDIFIRDDVFDILYYEAKRNDLDLVQIRDIYNENYTLNKDTRVNYPAKHFIKRESYNKSFPETQPNLKNNLFIKGNLYLLWGLLIKTDIYKKSIYHLWPLIFNYQLIYYEDYVITTIIIILTKKYKYLNNFALIHLNHKNSSMIKFYDQFHISVLICQNIFHNYYLKDNPRDIKISINYLKRYKKIYKFSYKEFKKYLSYNIINILNNVYITNNDKKFIMKELNITYNEFKLWNSYNYFMNSSQFNKIYNFQQLCSKESINRNSYINPKISIIVYCFNSIYLKKTLNSIQNQHNIDFEIIVIYDNETDISFIQDYLRKYRNINIINNNRTKGILSSYICGVIESKGEFILCLKSGETLAKNEVLNKLYYKIHNSSYDILEFNLLINNNDYIKENSLRLYRCKHIESQYNFDSFKYNKDYPGLDQEKEIITNKLIRARFFKNIIYKYKLNKLKININIYYDKIILSLFLKENSKLIRDEIFGIIKYDNIINLLYKNNEINNNNQKINESIFYINFLFENANNSFKEKEYVLNEFFNEFSIIFNKFNKNNLESNIVYHKFLNCQYISNFNKNKLKFYYKSLLN